MKDPSLLETISAEEFYETVFKENSRYVLNYVRAYVHEKVYVEDIVQETFLAAWKSIDKIQMYESTQAWLIATTKNIIKSHFRSEKKNRLVLGTLKESYSGKDKTEQDGGALFAGLGPADAIILKMFYIDHMSTREIAEALDIKESTTRSRLARARHKLEKSLDEKNLLKKIVDRCNILMFF